MRMASPAQTPRERSASEENSSPRFPRSCGSSRYFVTRRVLSSRPAETWLNRKTPRGWRGRQYRVNQFLGFVQPRLTYSRLRLARQAIADARLGKGGDCLDQ